MKQHINDETSIRNGPHQSLSESFAECGRSVYATLRLSILSTEYFVTVMNRRTLLPATAADVHDAVRCCRANATCRRSLNTACADSVQKKGRIVGWSWQLPQPDHWHDRLAARGCSRCAAGGSFIGSPIAKTTSLRDAVAAVGLIHLPGRQHQVRIVILLLQFYFLLEKSELHSHDRVITRLDKSDTVVCGCWLISCIGLHFYPSLFS